MEKFVCACQSAANAAAGTAPADITDLLGIWVPAIVALVTLVANICFTVFVAPTITQRHTQKIAMYKICTDFFDYLTDLVSFTDFNHAPSTVRKFSLQIHFMFTSGEAPQKIADELEQVYQKVKERKKLQTDEEISQWETDYRAELHQLRKDLARYVGVFRRKK